MKPISVPAAILVFLTLSGSSWAYNPPMDPFYLPHTYPYPTTPNLMVFNPAFLRPGILLFPRDHHQRY